MSHLPQFLRDMLENPPRAGQGVHLWLFKVARYLHHYHSSEEICAILQEHAADCGRELEPHEIPDAIRNSGTCKWEPSGKSASEKRAEWIASPTIRRVPEFVRV